MLEPLTRETMLAEMERLFVAFPRRAGESAAGVARVYYESLKHFPADAVRYAARKAVDNNQHFPRVADLRESAARWQQANNASVALVRLSDDGTCSVCGAREVWKELPPPPGATDEYMAIIGGSYGRLVMEHDRRAHNVSESP